MNLQFSKKKQQISLNDLLWDFDGVILFPSAMSDEKSIYPRIETGYAYTPNMKNELVENFDDQTFTQGIAILKIKFYNPKNLIGQHLPIKEKVKKTQINGMRNAYFVDVVTPFDIHEVVKNGWSLSENHEGVKLVENRYFNNPNSWEFKMNGLNKIEVIVRNLHEIKNEILREYEGDFEMIGSLKVGDQFWQTHITFRNIVDDEHYLNAIYEGYGSEYSIFNGYICILNTPQIINVIRSQYGNGCDSKHQIIEYHGNSCYMPIIPIVSPNV